MTLEICTLYKGVPHGMTVINYTDPEDEELSFRGVGIFQHGQLHNSPFSCLPGDNYPYFFANMHNGRPADASYHT